LLDYAIKLQFSFLFKETKRLCFRPSSHLFTHYSVNGQRTEMSVGKDCLPEKWNSKAGLAFGAKNNIKALNTPTRENSPTTQLITHRHK